MRRSAAAHVALVDAREAATVVLALPVAFPLIGVAAALSLAARLAPSLPPVTMPPAGEANLLVHLLAEAAPSLLGNAAKASRKLG